MKRRYLDRGRDAIVHAYGPTFRLSAAVFPSSLNGAMNRHKVARQDASLLSAALGGSLLLMDVKGEERCIVSMTVRDGQKEVYAESIPAVGEVRAYVKQHLESARFEADVTTCTRVLYGNAKPVVSVVAGVGEAGVSNLFARSTPKTVRLWSAGIMTLEHTPGTPPLAADLSTLAHYDENVGGPISHMEKIWLPALCPSPETLAKALESVRAINLAFHCRCTKKQFVSNLGLLQRSVLEEMRVRDQRELICHYCAKAHYLEDADFDSLIKNKV